MSRLGFAPPRARCPHCCEEGRLHDDQTVRNHARKGQPLADTIRFACTKGHVWTVPIDDAMLMGAFLDRQRS